MRETMRNRHIATYDVSDPKRLHKTAKKLEGFGDGLQHSVFACDLSQKELVLLKAALMEIINEKEDRALDHRHRPGNGEGREDAHHARTASEAAVAGGSGGVTGFGAAGCANAKVLICLEAVSKSRRSGIIASL